MGRKVCALRGCREPLTPGIVVEFRTPDDNRSITVCDHHGVLIMQSQPGAFEITKRLELKFIPAHPQKE